jgi:hypothetical protein
VSVSAICSTPPRAEVERIIKETKGDTLAQIKVLIGKLHKRHSINDKEVSALSQLAEAGHEAGAGKKSAILRPALHNTLLASPRTSSVALGPRLVCGRLLFDDPRLGW